MQWVKLSVLSCLFLVSKCWGMSYHELEDFSNFLRTTSQLDQAVKSTPNNEDVDEPISPHAWEESGKFEGDLILNERQRRLIVEDAAVGLSRNGLRDGTKRWPDNEVIYYIQKDHFSDDQVEAIQNGIEDLARASCVKFRPYRKGDRDAVVIQGSRRGCFSQVGYQGGYQVLNLSGRHPVGKGCFRHGTVVHEMLHTLGFYHMQSSPDRDDHIDVVWENIYRPARHNFRKYNSFSVSDFGVGYDYDSVMHYSRKAFSSNGRDTLVPKKDAEIGQRVGLSEKDTLKLNKMYCDADSNNNNDASEESTLKPVVNKKSRKNQPFQGHGIGYHQGKTVIIKIPAAETYRLPDVPSVHVFDYFSKTPETVSAPALVVEGFGIGKEIAKPNYVPVTFEFGKHQHQSKFDGKGSELKNYKSRSSSENSNESDENRSTDVKSAVSSSEDGGVSNTYSDISDESSEEIQKDSEKSYKMLEPISKLNYNSPYYINTDYSEFYIPNFKSENNPKIKQVDELFSGLTLKKPKEKNMSAGEVRVSKFQQYSNSGESESPGEFENSPHSSQEGSRNRWKPLIIQNLYAPIYDNAYLGKVRRYKIMDETPINKASQNSVTESAIYFSQKESHYKWPNYSTDSKSEESQEPVKKKELDTMSWLFGDSEYPLSDYFKGDTRQYTTEVYTAHIPSNSYSYSPQD